MKNIRAILEDEAERFINLRKKRFTQKVPSIN